MKLPPCSRLSLREIGLKIVFTSIWLSNPLDTSFSNGSSSNFNRKLRNTLKYPTRALKIDSRLDFSPDDETFISVTTQSVFYFSFSPRESPGFLVPGNFRTAQQKCKFKQMCLELWFIKSRSNNKIFHSRPHALYVICVAIGAFSCRRSPLTPLRDRKKLRKCQLLFNLLVGSIARLQQWTHF